MGKPLTQSQRTQLLEWFSQERFSTGASACELHIHDISPHRCPPPSGVVWPQTTEEVAKVMAWAYQEEIAITPWGAGTSTEGNPLPIEGGLVVDLTGPGRVLLQSRSTDHFLSWLIPQLPKQTTYVSSGSSGD